MDGLILTRNDFKRSVTWVKFLEPLKKPPFHFFTKNSEIHNANLFPKISISVEHTFTDLIKGTIVNSFNELQSLEEHLESAVVALTEITAVAHAVNVHTKEGKRTRCDCQRD